MGTARQAGDTGHCQEFVVDFNLLGFVLTTSPPALKCHSFPSRIGPTPLEKLWILSLLLPNLTEANMA